MFADVLADVHGTALPSMWCLLGMCCWMCLSRGMTSVVLQDTEVLVEEALAEEVLVVDVLKEDVRCDARMPPAKHGAPRCSGRMGLSQAE